MEGLLSLSDAEHAHITGVQVNYYFICKTKLWLFSHLATMEHTSDTVALGRVLHQGSYTRHKREVAIGAIKIDFLKRGDEIVLHEVKKSRRMEKAHRYQMLYYLYYLKQRGVKARGIINYPLMRRREEVILSSEDEEEIEGILAEIARIVAEKEPPKAEKKRYCRKCSYFEFCWVV